MYRELAGLARLKVFLAMVRNLKMTLHGCDIKLPQPETAQDAIDRLTDAGIMLWFDHASGHINAKNCMHACQPLHDPITKT